MKRTCGCFWVHHGQCLTAVLCSVIFLFNLSNISRQKQQTTAALWVRDVLRWETPSLQTSQQHMISAWMQEMHSLAFIFTHHTCMCAHSPTHLTVHLKQHKTEINKEKKCISEQLLGKCSLTVAQTYHIDLEKAAYSTYALGGRFMAIIRVSWPPLKTNVQNVCTLIPLFYINSKGLAISSNYRQTYHVM